MQNLFLRILIAVVCAVALILIIPAALRLIGFPVNDDLMLIIRIVIAVIALLYIIGGERVNGWFKSA